MCVLSVCFLTLNIITFIHFASLVKLLFFFLVLLDCFMCFSIFIPSLLLFSSSPPFPASYTGQASTPHSTFTIIYPTRYKVYLNNNTGSSLNNEQNVSAIASLTTTKKSRNQTREKEECKEEENWLWCCGPRRCVYDVSRSRSNANARRARAAESHRSN